MSQAVVTRNSRVMHGTPCFAGTRVPVKILFDYLEGGYNVDYFLLQFPTVERDQVLTALTTAREKLETDAAIVEPKE
jgi:uncharacterized protein (DUF433 family)